MTEHTKLWHEFDAMAFNLKEQAHAPGVGALEGRAMLDVAARIERVLKSYMDTAEDRKIPEPLFGNLPVEAVTKIERDGTYWVRVPPRTSVDLVETATRKLAEKLPEATFVFVSGDMELIDSPVSRELLPVQDLLAAIKQAGDALQLQNTKAPTQESQGAYAGGMFALRELRKALTQPDAPEDAPSPEPDAPEDGPSLPVLCHLQPFEGANGCVLFAGHEGSTLHQDAFGNRWSW